MSPAASPKAGLGEKGRKASWGPKGVEEEEEEVKQAIVHDLGGNLFF